MHSSTDIRIVKCLDGLSLSFSMLECVYADLHETCTRIPYDKGAHLQALLKCWSFVDLVHRIREIAQAAPGLSGNQPELRVFLAKTQLAEDFRHYIQHLRSELSKQSVNPFPVWGTLAWVDPFDESTSHILVLGAQIEGTSYTGCIFDNFDKRWVSRVCLGVLNKSFNFDPVYEACTNFRDFILPWAIEHYEPGVQVTSELPILTGRFEVQGQQAAQQEVEPDAE